MDMPTPRTLALLTTLLLACAADPAADGRAPAGGSPPPRRRVAFRDAREDRHADAAQFLAALEACRDPGAHITPPRPREQTSRDLPAQAIVTPAAIVPDPGRPWVLIGCLLAVCLAGAGYLLLMLRAHG